MINVLHVVGRMDRGGVETWLMHLLRAIDGTRVRIDFLVHDERPGAFDHDIEGFGSRLIHCPRPQSASYPFRLYRILKGPPVYHAVHSHVHHFSGLVLAVGRLAGVPIRIAHSHNDFSGQVFGVRHRIYQAIMRTSIGYNATHRVAVSREAGKHLYGDQGFPRVDDYIMRLGIEVLPASSGERSAVRQELGFSPDHFVLCNVGRFSRQKNHLFLLRLMAAILDRDRSVRLVLVGDGELRDAIERSISTLGIRDVVRLLGVRADVLRLLRGMDLFLMPSLHEGLPVALLEAQALGLPCVVSSAITEEASYILQNVRRVSLSGEIGQWVDAVLDWKAAPSEFSETDCLRLFEASGFNIRCNVREIEGFYERAAESARARWHLL